MAYFFTSDEHLNHFGAIEHNNRPFNSVDKMNQTLIDRNNEIVGPDDTVIRCGDFTLRKSRKQAEAFIGQLNGTQVFLKGSHDYWQKKKPIDFDPGEHHEIWEKEFEVAGHKHYIVACHYAMRSWHKSHWFSWQLHGHHHGSLRPYGLQMDIGVDTNDFYPYSLDQIVKIMVPREKLARAAISVFKDYQNAWNWITSSDLELKGLVPLNVIKTETGLQQCLDILEQFKDII